jgi:hypothetical protein
VPYLRSFFDLIPLNDCRLFFPGVGSRTLGFGAALHLAGQNLLQRFLALDQGP